MKLKIHHLSGTATLLGSLIDTRTISKEVYVFPFVFLVNLAPRLEQSINQQLYSDKNENIKLQP